MTAEPTATAKMTIFTYPTVLHDMSSMAAYNMSQLR